jgi:hypothetical protein
LPKLGKSFSETFQMMKQPYGQGTLARIAEFKWHKSFAQGRDSFKDDEHISRPRTVRTELKIEEFATLVHANRSQMVYEIAAAAGISHGTCNKILSGNMNMSRVTQHSVSRVLTPDQHDDRLCICGDLINSGQRRLF